MHEASYNTDDSMTEEEMAAQLDVNGKAHKLFETVSKLFSDGNLNSEYFKEDVQIGHTYFLVESEEQLFMRFKYQILPILREYHKDGMFQFDTDGGLNDAWTALLNCIAGNISSDEAEVRHIFDSLIN